MHDKSDSQAVGVKDVVILFAAIASLLAFAEVATRKVVIPASRIERRVEAEIESAHAARGPRSLLVIGNSLLLHGIRAESIDSLVPVGWRAWRLPVEQTSYLDWKYGLHELWNSGAHPTVTAIMLDPGQLTSSQTRTDYSALRLIGAGDVIPMGRDAQLHPTEISRLVLSHFSTYFGFRGESRKVLIAKVIPGMADLVELMLGKGGGAVDTIALRTTATERLRELQAEVQSSGSRFVFILPPLLDNDAQLRAAAQAARDAGIALVMPDLSKPYVAADFLDGYHLTDAGAARFEAEVREGLARLGVFE